MNRSRRITMLLAVLAVAPFLLGAGGSQKGIDAGTHTLDSDVYQAFFVMDTHPYPAGESFSGDTSNTAKQGFVTVRDKQGNSAQATFNARLGAQFFAGCNTALTVTRFADTDLDFYIELPVLAGLFRQLGVTIDSNHVPHITGVANDACVNVIEMGAANPGKAIVGPGWLIFDATIQIKVPLKK